MGYLLHKYKVEQTEVISRLLPSLFCHKLQERLSDRTYTFS